MTEAIAQSDIAQIDASEGPTSGGPVAVAFLRPLGDAVCMLPPLRFLARIHRSPVHVIVKKAWQKRLYAGIDFVAAVHVLDTWRLPLWLSPAQMALVKDLRAAALSKAHIMASEGSRKCRKCRKILTRAGMALDAVAIGIPEWQNPGATPPEFRPDESDMAPPELRVFPDETAAMRQRLRGECGWNGEPIVFIHPGHGSMAGSKDGLASKSSKSWGWENWARVAAGVREKMPDAFIVFTGSGIEQRLVKHICEAAGGKAARMFDWSARTSMGELLALQSLASSGLSPDTGTAHTALAVGCPMTVLYGNVDPRFMGTSPHGWGPCHTIRGADIGPRILPNSTRPIRNIMPETALEVWSALPARLPAPPAKSHVTHFLEGKSEPEVQLAGPGRFWNLE